jgi:membrane associated rhomboid family serine protease
MVSGVQGIDYWAHIGGLLVGVGIGLVLKPFVYRRNPVVRFLAEESVSIKR